MHEVENLRNNLNLVHGHAEIKLKALIPTTFAAASQLQWSASVYWQARGKPDLPHHQADPADLSFVYMPPDECIDRIYEFGKDF